MIYKIETTITGTMFDVRYFLEGNEVHLAYDGIETYSSTDLVDVDGNLDLTCRVTGLNGTKWALALDVTKPDDEDYSKAIKRKSLIEKNQTKLLILSTDLTAKEK